jgi:ankyrin repeat protein
MFGSCIGSPKFNPNMRDKQGNTLLHYMAVSGDIRSAQNLLHRGVNLTRNKDGYTAQEFAIMSNNLTVARIIENEDNRRMDNVLYNFMISGMA